MREGAGGKEAEQHGDVLEGLQVLARDPGALRTVLGWFKKWTPAFAEPADGDAGGKNDFDV
ncbi:hypothetical protein DIPPA_13607 [Diplonema papillatum]|nr:hypothetical protein DIPPA_13607 [Diplonema papillatum]